jgi:hypothetical protein
MEEPAIYGVRYLNDSGPCIFMYCMHACCYFTPCTRTKYQTTTRLIMEYCFNSLFSTQ